MKIVSYKRCFYHNLKKRWEWSCPVWFNTGLFADAWVKPTKEFDTMEEAEEDMVKTMKKFGVTKRTQILW